MTAEVKAKASRLAAELHRIRDELLKDCDEAMKALDEAHDLLFQLSAAEHLSQVQRKEPRAFDKDYRQAGA